ncbi:nicotinamide-nucleotide adenylyltransferase [Ochrobactrum phage vB_OspM_OC]|nr:nicotinamide-nucleotide adenylyltransferase [Ochrobactrum phage vB_OspM_OC]
MRIVNSVVLMTALLPTRGHEDLIRFASSITFGKVHVIVSSRSFEPIYSIQRTEALVSFARRENLNNVEIISHADDQAPQNPNPDLETTPGADVKFWKYWTDAIVSLVNDVVPDTAIISSEPYGQIIADKFGCRFVPYDIDRVLNPIKGTTARQNIKENWMQLSQYFRENFQQRFVIFGQESVGKTTMAKALADDDKTGHTLFVPEYARGYLEHVGAELTKEKMENISFGQSGYQKAVIGMDQYHTIIHDTDLFSTVGYYRIMDLDINTNPYLLKAAKKMSYEIDRYFLMPDDIPFEQDQLRYGGDQRESSYEFWKDLLDEFNIRYVEVPRGLNFEEKKQFIRNSMDEEFDRISKNIVNFIRE